MPYPTPREFILLPILYFLGAKAEVIALNEGLELRVRERTQDLEKALAQVKRLQGLLPICAWCKKVRDDKDYWHSVEDYISERTDARFSHSICPDCYAAASAEVKSNLSKGAMPSPNSSTPDRDSGRLPKRAG